MAISVVMPALEMAQETGKLISWLKKEGDSVAKGEALLEIETDKAVMEIESPGDGVLAGVKVQPGAEVPVGRTIAWIVRPGEVPPTDEVATTSGRKTTAVAPSAGSSPASVIQGAQPVSHKPLRFPRKRDVSPANVASILLMSEAPVLAEKSSLPTFSLSQNPKPDHRPRQLKAAARSPG